MLAKELKEIALKNAAEILEHNTQLCIKQFKTNAEVAAKKGLLSFCVQLEDNGSYRSKQVVETACKELEKEGFRYEFVQKIVPNYSYGTGFEYEFVYVYWD